MKLKVNRNAVVLLVLLGSLVLASPAAAADPASAPATKSPGSDRLFQAFAEDAAVVPGQWWEGQADFTNYNDLDVITANFVGAFRPIQDLEVGVDVGFGNSDATGNVNDGTGATDTDIWGKWLFGGGGGPTDFAVGGLATIPTGDDTAGLGHNAFDVEAFGAMRYRLPSLIVVAHLGFRLNGDGKIQGVDLNGKTSAIVGGGVIFPLTDSVGLVGELNMESARWDHAKSDVRLLGGINWHATARGIVRGSVTVGLTDGAPDSRFLAGYAYTF